ncbi:MAG: F0F1 ATP synthase subunit B [Bacillota bacterium]
MKAGLVEVTWTLLFQIVNTLILFMILKKLLFKPVTEFMQSRQNAISGAIKEAEDKNKEADQIMKQYQAKLEGVQEEGRQIIKEATQRAEQRADEIAKNAQTDASKLKERAEADIQREKQKAINALKDELAGLAVMAAGKIIDKNLDAGQHETLIKEFIDEVGEAKWHN